MMSTGVIILNYNNAQCTVECIESLQRYNTASVKILVVDNCSTDNSIDILTQYSATIEFHIIKSEENGGYARGNNLGLQYFEQDEDVDSILILNNDVLFVQDIIPELKDFAFSTNDAAVVSPLLLCGDGVSIDYNCARKDCSFEEVFWSYALYFRNSFGILSHLADKRKILLNNPDFVFSDNIPVELPSGSCMFVKKQLFKEIGYFDPNTFLYYEENILFRKFERLGKTSYVLPSIKCIHLGGKTTNKVPHSSSYMKNSKNSGYYFFSHYRGMTIFQKMLLNMVHSYYQVMVDIVKGVKSLFCKWSK